MINKKFRKGVNSLQVGLENLKIKRTTNILRDNVRAVRN